MAIPYIMWVDEDRLLIEILAEQVREHGLYVLLDIPGVREPLVRWFADEIHQRYEQSQPPGVCQGNTDTQIRVCLILYARKDVDLYRGKIICRSMFETISRGVHERSDASL